MTAGETASEKKRSRRYWGFGLIGAVVLVAAALIFWPRAGGRQPLSLTVLGYTNYVRHGMVNASSPKLVFAGVAVTNSTKEILALGSVCVFRKGETDWRGPAPSRSGPYFFLYGPQPSKLLPGQGFMFGAGIPTDRPCKVGINYLNDSLRGRLWQKLPPWLTKDAVVGDTLAHCQHRGH